YCGQDGCMAPGVAAWPAMQGFCVPKKRVKSGVDEMIDSPARLLERQPIDVTRLLSGEKMSEQGQALALGACDEGAAPVTICLLGDFRLLQDGKLLPLRAGGKSEALLSYLGLQYNRRVPRERLIQALWPQADLALGLNSLNNLIYTLHRQL